jgi:glutathione synthase/RimK-type ligase-like ATP-grasp enzyme
VALELRRRGAPYRVFDPASFPSASSVTMDGSGDDLSVHIAGDGAALDLRTVTGIWYRRPGPVRPPDQLRPEEAEWLRRECEHFMAGVWATVDAVWVSEPRRIREASLKLHQLNLARGLGFRVPRFIVTNEVSRARAFVTAFPTGVVVKTLALPSLVVDDRAALLYTHVLTREDVRYLDAVRFGPTLLQEFVPKRLDVRVTVIGETLFAVGIESGGVESARADIRGAEIYDLPHRPIDLPGPVAAACLALVAGLGLRFGAIDLLLTPEGEFVFLEINPNGQWHWLEEITGLPMTKALCDLLTLRAVR